MLRVTRPQRVPYGTVSGWEMGRKIPRAQASGTPQASLPARGLRAVHSPSPSSRPRPRALALPPTTLGPICSSGVSNVDIWGTEGVGSGGLKHRFGGQPCPAPGTPLTGWRGLSGCLAQGGAEFDGDLAHPLEVSILLSLQVLLLCLQLLHVGKEVSLDDRLEALKDRSEHKSEPPSASPGRLPHGVHAETPTSIQPKNPQSLGTLPFFPFFFCHAVRLCDMGS